MLIFLYHTFFRTEISTSWLFLKPRSILLFQKFLVHAPVIEYTILLFQNFMVHAPVIESLLLYMLAV
jgi:hypothetical protein